MRGAVRSIRCPLDRRIRVLEPELRAPQRAFAEELSEPRAVYRVLDTTLIPAIARVRASESGEGLSPAKRASDAAPPKPSGSTPSRWR